ncbi:hypothetical protein TWF730_002363 [Orbilia blumenaviensis]|uniref:DUF6603 domain-containing protein n=1 Tax=Orbilia blumenaviensis TaxID=1796055 RepID=A0AAV9UBZ8_9PEZI
MTDYGVDSFHISIGVGDCAIHLLLSNTKNAKPTVLQAILIDGGLSKAPSNLAKITQAISWIEQKYTLGTVNCSDGKLRFDSVMVSHWDQDHYQGIIGLLQADIETQAAASPSTNVAQLRLSTYLNYDSSGDPLSIFYAPYTNLQRAGIGIPAEMKFTEVNNVQYLNIKRKGTSTLVNKVCIVRAGDTLIGQNILNWQSTGSFSNNSLADLLKNNPPASAGMPGIYCVAVNMKVIGPSAVGIVDKKTTATNSSSIALLVIWSGGTSPNPRLSHYFAGDLDYQTEQKIANWIPAGVTCTSMKLSHHGAESSTPSQLLDKFKPYNYVMSSGTSYGHPRWPIIFYIEALKRAQGVVGANTKPIFCTMYPYYLTQYLDANTNTMEFYNFSRDAPTKVFSKIFPDGSTDPIVVYRKLLDNVYDTKVNVQTGITPVNSPYQAYLASAAFNDPQDWAKYTWICQQVASSWQDLSIIKPYNHPGVGGRWGPRNKPIRADTQLQWIRVVSRSSASNSDGYVWEKDGSPNEIPWSNIEQTPATTIKTRKPQVPKNVVCRSAVSQYNLRPKRKNVANGQVSAVVADSGSNDTDELSGLVKKRRLNDSDEVSDGEESDKDTTLTNKPEEANTTGQSSPSSPTDGDGTGYFIVCSSMAPSSPDPATIQVLADTDPFDKFVTCLHNGFFELAVSPSAAAVSMAPDDEMSTWLQSATGATSVTCTFDSSNKAISMSLETDGWTYGTEFVNQNLKLSPAVVQPPGASTEQNLVYDGVLILALSPTTTLSGYTLEKLMTAAGYQDSPLLKILGAVNLELTQDEYAGSRNAIWFDPADAYSTVIRKQFYVQQEELQTVSSWIQSSPFGKNITPNSFAIITKQTSHWSITSDGETNASNNEVIFWLNATLVEVNTDIIVKLDSSSIGFELLINTANALDSWLTWLANVCSVPPDLQSWISAAQKNKIVGVPQLREIAITFELNADGKIGDLQAVKILLESDILLGNPNAAKGVNVFLFTYTWEGTTAGSKLSGALWCPPPPGVDDDKQILDPSWEAYDEFTPLTTKTNPNLPLNPYLDLISLLPESTVQNVPTNLPTAITEVNLSISSSEISFAGAISVPPPTSSSSSSASSVSTSTDVSTVPTVYLGKVELSASYTFATSTPTFNFGLALGLVPSPDSKFSPAEMAGEIAYKEGTWSITASVYDLYAATLYNFFDTNSQSHVMKVLEHFEIKSLDLAYNYTTNAAENQSSAKSFTFKGVIMLGVFELDLTFDYNTDPKVPGWTFKAGLSPDVTNTQSTTLGEVVKYICGNEALGLLPDFVESVNVAPPKGDDLLEIKCVSLQGKDEPQAVISVASISISALKFSFAQYRGLAWEKSLPSKRVVKVSVTELPKVSIPIVGDLTQPFDEMYYLWVSDETKTNGAEAQPGLKLEELNALNQQLDADDQIFYKALKASPGQDDVVIQAGSHFMIVIKDDKGTPKVLLDYVFGQKTTSTKSPTPKIEEAEGENNAAVEPASADPTPPTPPPNPADTATTGDASKTPYKKTIGPLSIENIGFQYANQTLSVLMDASLKLGPITFDLLGFSIGVSLSSPNTLQNLVTSLSFTLAGLAVSFQDPPLDVAGAFIRGKDVSPITDLFGGGIVAAFEPWKFAAAGFYGEFTGPPTVKSIFVFAELDGPLITLEFATISGVRAGFGYNVSIREPKISEVPTFPLLTLGDTTDVVQTLKTLITPGPDNYFNLSIGDMWVAAGFNIDAFKMVSLQTVAVFQWSPDIKIGLYGVATCDIPSLEASLKFAHVEFGVLAVVDFGAGVVKIEAQLAPTSYILDPSCHLTGGFAYYSWFKNGPQQVNGDWVFTIGGYHRAFTPPPQYPQVDRLAISWSVSDSVTVTGQAYFAITPKVCMGGGSLHAALSLGPLGAYFDAYADFLINYKPFYFNASASVSVGVTFTLDLLITTIHINVELGATLDLMGPPLHGTVHVNFWVFGFSVNFGDQNPPDLDMSLQDFYYLVLQNPKPSSSNTLTQLLLTSTTNPPADLPHLLTCQKGMMPPAATPQSSPSTSGGNADTTLATTPSSAYTNPDTWQVRPGTFVFQVACRFALNSATVNGTSVSTVQPGGITVDTLYSTPMGLWTALTSSVEVTIGPNTSSSSSSFAEVQGINDEADAEASWQTAMVATPQPVALWGKYDPASDPTKVGNNVSTLLNGKENTANLLSSIVITAPPPMISQDTIPKFDALKAMQEPVPAGTFPDETPSDTDRLPQPPVAGAQQWTNIEQEWAKAPTVNALVTAWQTVMGWKGPALTGAPPANVLANFDNLYLGAPLFSKSSGTVPPVGDLDEAKSMLIEAKL